MESNDKLMGPGQVAELFHVDPKTVTRWAKTGKLKSVRMPSGRYRFWLSDVLAILEDGDDAA